MRLIKYPSRSEWTSILSRPVFDFSVIEDRVAPILKKIKEQGDIAVKEFTLLFDKVELLSFEVSKQEIEEAQGLVSQELKAAIELASKNIAQFHNSQKEEVKIVETTAGVTCWRKSVGIAKVGLYIPGGTAPLFSTVLMLGIPAKIAGCKEIILCTPANQEGKVHPAILYAASSIGIEKIYKIGGAQAIAAMAYGTATVPAVYKIFGPGNQYVTAAKQLVNKDGVAIDMPAGPSEVLVYADETANPAFVAADLLSQAEHGSDSQVILVSCNEAVLQNVSDAVAHQLEKLPRKELAEKSLANSRLIQAKDEQEAIELINEYAPEHLILSVDKPELIAEHIINSGSVFMGHLTPESAGDYASGTNHTLPTNGYARAYSGVSLDSFVKKITFQTITADGLRNIGPAIEKMAAAEELEAHKNAVTLRLQALK